MEKLEFEMKTEGALPSITVTTKDGKTWKLTGTLAVFEIRDTGGTVPGQDMRVQVVFATQPAPKDAENVAPPPVDRMALENLEFREGVGERVRSARVGRGLTVTEFARLASVHASQISRLETGQRLPDATTLVRLGTALNVPVDWILTGRPWADHE